MASGGFRPSLKTTSQGVTEQASFMASEHSMSKRVGVVIAASTVGADANGDKFLRAGTVIASTNTTDKNAPRRAYLNSLGATVGGTAEGFLPESINLRDGDVTVGLILHGSVLEARCSGLDSAAKTDLAGRIIFQ